MPRESTSPPDSKKAAKFTLADLEARRSKAQPYSPPPSEFAGPRYHYNMNGTTTDRGVDGDQHVTTRRPDTPYAANTKFYDQLVLSPKFTARFGDFMPLENGDEKECNDLIVAAMNKPANGSRRFPKDIAFCLDRIRGYNGPAAGLELRDVELPDSHNRIDLCTVGGDPMYFHDKNHVAERYHARFDGTLTSNVGERHLFANSGSIGPLIHYLIWYFIVGAGLNYSAFDRAAYDATLNRLGIDPEQMDVDWPGECALETVGALSFAVTEGQHSNL